MKWEFRWPSRRWLVLLLGAWAAVWVLAWWAVPVWLHGAVPAQLHAALGRELQIDRVSFKPWSLELELSGLRIAGASPDAAPLLDIERVYIDAELQSVLRLAPVVDALLIDRPRLHLKHLGDGRYDIDDLLARWAQRPKEGPSATFGLFNLALNGGELQLDDVPTGAVHRLRDLTVAVPFLSNLPTQRNVRTEPRVAFELNGSRFDTQLSTLPFADTLATRAHLKLPDLDLAPYLAYWPKSLPWRPLQARVQADLTLSFEQQQVPVVQLAGQLAVRDLRLAHAGGGRAADQPLLSWDALSLVMDNSLPLARQVHLKQMTLQAPQLHLARGAQGQINLIDLLPPVSSSAAAEPATPAWNLRLDRFELTDGRLHWRDESLSPAWESRVEALTLSAGALAWPATAPIQVAAGARWQGAALALQGEVSPTQAELALNWRDLALRGAAPYVAQVLTQPLSGRSAGDVVLRWQAAAPQARPPAPGLMQLHIKDVSLHDLALGPAGRTTAGWRDLRLLDGQIDLNARSADLGQLSLTRPVLNLTRNADGRWNWADVLRPAPADVTTGEAAPAGTPWRVGWQGLRLSEGSGRLDDAATPTPTSTPVAVRWSALQLQLGPWRSDVAVDTPVSLSARLAADLPSATTHSATHATSDITPGSMALNGRLALRPATATSAAGGTLAARLKLDRLPAHALAPYVGDRLNLALQRADASWTGDLNLSHDAAGLGVTAAGDFSVDDVRAVDALDASPLLDWKSLQLRGLRLALLPGQALQLGVAETTLSDYFARIDIDPTGRINLQDLLRPTPAPAQAQGSASVPPAAPAVAAPPAQLSFGPIAVVNGNIAFSDRFVRPNYSARLSEVTGGLGAFSNQSGAGAAPAKVSLRGRVEGTGSLDINGELNPLVTPPVLDIVGKVRELELPPLSTYSLKYTGHGIERGQLSVDVRYQVGADGQLNASNQLTLNRLVLGERAPDSQAPNLPVRLAVALLADRQGVIDLHLPISGSLNDPEFRIGPIIGRLILGLIGKAVTAPFALLGQLLGGAEAQTGHIDFVPGTDRIADGAASALAGIVKALNDRPALQLTVVGHSDLAAEHTAFQRERLQEAVRAEKRRQAARSGQGSGQGSAEAAVSPEEYPALLREVYRRSEGPKPRNAIGMLKDLSVPEMEALWLTHAPAPDEALRQLATRRAVAVKERLVAEGLAGARVFVEVARESVDGSPQQSTKNSATAGAGAPGPRADLQLSLP